MSRHLISAQRHVILQKDRRDHLMQTWQQIFRGHDEQLTFKVRSNLDLSTEDEKLANKAAISACRLPEEDRKLPAPQLRNLGDGLLISSRSSRTAAMIDAIRRPAYDRGCGRGSFVLSECDCPVPDKLSHSLRTPLPRHYTYFLSSLCTTIFAISSCAKYPLVWRCAGLCSAAQPRYTPLLSPSSN
jgi:hypothetical protein